MVGGAARQHRAAEAGEPAHEAAVDAQGHEIDHGMGRDAWPGIAEPRQQGGAHEVVVADHRGARRQALLDPPQLPPVEYLPMGEMDVGDTELAEIEDLADPVDDGARRQGDDHGRGGPGMRAPHGEPMDAAGQRRPGIDAAEPFLDHRDVLGRLLHQQQVGPLALHQGDDGIDLGSGAPQQVPAHDLAEVAAVQRIEGVQVRESGGILGRVAAVVERAAPGQRKVSLVRHLPAPAVASSSLTLPSSNASCRVRLRCP
ncbi:hypothetical protein ASF08_07020 [Methylobacterium sp. Leaf85]|nr:hypothetical protein ASF08_07020 [Methylobacterium sp. Leaf85]